MCAAPPIVGAWSMAVLLWQYYYYYICGYVCIVGDYSTHLRRTGITVWLGLIFVGISVLKGLILYNL